MINPNEAKKNNPYSFFNTVTINYVDKNSSQAYKTIELREPSLLAHNTEFVQQTLFSPQNCNDNFNFGPMNTIPGTSVDRDGKRVRNPNADDKTSCCTIS